MIQSGSSSVQANYTYDPNGNMTISGGARTPWPFLYHGLEQEYDDTWKLYMEPRGNAYNPAIPGDLSLVGPQGLDAFGAGPGSIGGPGGGGGGGLPLFVQNDLNQSGTAALVAATTALDSTGWGIAIGTGLQLIAGLLPDLFGGGDSAKLPRQVTNVRRLPSGAG